MDYHDLEQALAEGRSVREVAWLLKRSVEEVEAQLRAIGKGSKAG
jgi:hypothetical protein